MWLRSAPETRPSTTSLTLTPSASFTARTSSRLTEANELWRCGPTIPLKHGPATPNAIGFWLRCWRIVSPRPAVRYRYSMIFRGVCTVGISARANSSRSDGSYKPGVLVDGSAPARDRLGRVRLEVEQLLGEAGTRRAVHQAVVELGDQRHLTAGDAVDVPHLPQRPATVELVAHQHPEQVTDLAASARRRHGDAPEVLVDVEVLVLDPHRPIEVERDLLQLPAELRHPREPLEQRPAHLLEAEPVRLRRVHHREPTDVLVPRRRLRRQEQRVGSRKPLHRNPPLTWCVRRTVDSGRLRRSAGC